MDSDCVIENNVECAVCFSSLSLRSNKIITCMECGVNVHCNCYGNIEDIGIDNNWYCDICLFKQYHTTQFDHKLSIQCCLCPNIDEKYGPLKKTSNNQWAHIFCACWNPQKITFNNSFMKSPIIDNKNNDNNHNRCIICNKTYGITQKCYHPNCNTYFHPLCAKYHQYKTIIICNKNNKNEPILIQCCDEHKDINIDELISNQIKDKTQETKDNVLNTIMNELKIKLTQHIGPISIEQSQVSDNNNNNNNNNNMMNSNNMMEESIQASLSRQESLISSSYYSEYDEQLSDSSHNSDNSSMNESQEMSESQQINGELSLDQKLHRHDIALSKKDVIELLWNRSDKYHNSVTIHDYLRIAPHNFYHDPIFATPIKGKKYLQNHDNHTNHNSDNRNKRQKKSKKKTRKQNKDNLFERECNDKYNASFSYRYDENGISSQFHDLIESESNNRDYEWTLEGIKNQLINEYYNNENKQNCNHDDVLPINNSLNYFTNSSINKLPKAMDDNEISLIPHQLGLSLINPPIADFSNNMEETTTDTTTNTENIIRWDGQPSTYKVENDPFGWRWVLKPPELPPNIPTISCPCLLCQYISNQYDIKRKHVENLSIQIEKYLSSIQPQNGSEDNDQDIEDKDIEIININEPNISETRSFHKESINCVIKSKYGRVMTEFKPKYVDNNDDETRNLNKTIVEYKTMENNETKSNDSLQPRSVNIMEKIAMQRWKQAGDLTIYDRNTNVDEEEYLDEPRSIYHIDYNHNKNDNHNHKMKSPINDKENKTKKRRGRKRKRSQSNDEINDKNNENGYCSPKSKKRRKNKVYLFLFCF